MIDPKKLADFTLMLEQGLSQKEIQKSLKITKNQFEFYEVELSVMKKFALPHMVSEGFIDACIYQKRRLKYQKKWVIEKRWEIMAMKDDEAFAELFWEDMRLDQVGIKLEIYKWKIAYIQKFSSNVPIVAEKLQKVASSKV